MIYLDLEDLLYVALRTLEAPAEIRDVGLLESALARPRSSAFGADATLEEKAASLLHSLARNHALIDGNKRLALAATLAFLGLSGRRLVMTNDEAYDLVIAVATGAMNEIDEIAAALLAATAPWS